MYRDEEIPGDEEQAMGNEEEDTKEGVKDGLQTFVFSATLSKELQRNVKKKFRPKGNKKHYKRDQKPATTLGTLLPIFYKDLGSTLSRRAPTEIGFP